MGQVCEWRHVRKRWAENLVILKKTLVEIRLWAEPVQLEATGCAACLLDQIVQSLSPRVEKTKDKKLINVSYLNNGESSVFRISQHQYIFKTIYIYIYILEWLKSNILMT